MPTTDSAPHRRLVAAICVVAIIALAVSALAMPLVFRPHFQTAPPRHDLVTDGSTQTEAPVLIAAAGWPVQWTVTDAGSITPSMGRDGTVYLTQTTTNPDALVDTTTAVAIDASGKPRTDWLRLANGRLPTPYLYASDGTMYVLDDSQIYAFSPDGALLPGWPVAGSDVTGYDVGPSGNLYTVQDNQLVITGRDGKTIATSDSYPNELGALADYRVRPDGTFLAFSWSGDSVSVGHISAFDSTAHKLAGSPKLLWSGMTMGADGTVVAWLNETTGPDSDLAVKDTQVAVIGSDGSPVPGWPRTFNGAVSAPTVGTDGTVYLALAGSGSEPVQILAIKPTGTTAAGWPHSLPAGTTLRTDGTGQPGTPMYPVSPVLGRNGAIFVVTDTGSTESALSLDGAGRTRTGWPAALPGKITALGTDPCTDWCGTYYEDPIFAVTQSGQGILYLHIDSEILAFTDDGKVAKGWPEVLSTDKKVFYGYSWWHATPDGGLLTLEAWAGTDPANANTTYVLRRWNPDGTSH